MPFRVLIAPAGAGKTAHVLRCLQAASRAWLYGNAPAPLVILPNERQVRALQQRLAQQDGVLGPELLTFTWLARGILQSADCFPLVFDSSVQQRLVQVTVDGLAQEGDLPYHAALVGRSGFVAGLQELIGEFKRGGVPLQRLQRVLADYEDVSPRLTELAHIYARYQERLQLENWADREGIEWLALDLLRADPGLYVGHAVWVDGFDNLSSIQLALVEQLAARATELTVTLTGVGAGSQRGLAHKRFLQTLDRLRKIGGEPEPLVDAPCGMAPGLCAIEQHLFAEVPSEACQSAPITMAITMVAAPDRVTETRQALRWCKERILNDGLAPSEVAIVARHLQAYRQPLVDIAQEFGLQVRLAMGQPLLKNPCVSALLDLLQLMRSESGEPALPRAQVVEAWRSPYFSWEGAFQQSSRSGVEPVSAIVPGDARLLDQAARFGLVIKGWGQWQQALERMAQADLGGMEADEQSAKAIDPAIATELLAKLRVFVDVLTPPEPLELQAFVGWLEDLMGPDPDAPGVQASVPEHSLGLIARLRAMRDAEADLAAVAQLKQILKNMVLAERLSGMGRKMRLDAFLDELRAACGASTYMEPETDTEQRVLLADVLQVRGLSFKAVAILGLAEGEFPAIAREDPLLRESERRYLYDSHLQVDLRLDTDERGYFYEAVTRAREHLLLTRPRLADDGALWEPSPFWGEMARLCQQEPLEQGQSLPTWSEVASEQEVAALIAQDQSAFWSGLPDWVPSSICTHISPGIESFEARFSGRASPFEGDLSSLATTLATRYGPDHIWSPSRIEIYKACPFRLFISRVLGLTPRQEPEEGYDSAQWGGILHEVMERLYKSVSDPTSQEQLLAALPDIAEAVLATAPERYGFRVTTWWEATCAELLDLLHDNVVALCAEDDNGRWTPSRFEVRFGQGSAPALEFGRGPDRVRMHGMIDRVDLSPQGTVRVIDYKSGGSRNYTDSAFEEGTKLQIALYALAAQVALGLGEVIEGFYWGLGDQKPSGFQLAKRGVEASLILAQQHVHDVVRDVRAGRFVPSPPSGGCPSYCAAASFCWHYKPQSWGR